MASKILLFNSTIPFTPPTASLVANFDARLGVTLSGSNVTTWADQSGNGHDLTVPGFATNGPTASGTLSSSLITFNGTNQALKTSSFTLTQPVTIYLVGKQVAWSVSKAIYDGNTTASMDLATTSASPNISLNAGSFAAQNTGWTVGSIMVVTAAWDAASSTLSINDGTKTTGNAGSASPSGFTIGNAGGGGGFWSNIAVQQIYIYSAHHSNATQTSMVSYLRSSWGI